MTKRVCVLGSGVIGLSTALALSNAGFAVTVISAESHEQTVSSVAAAIWYPFLVAPKERTKHWAFRTFKHFEAIADQATSGVSMVAFDEVGKAPPPFPDWADLEDGYAIEKLMPDDCPPGFAGGWRTQVPLIEMPIYLATVKRQLMDHDVSFVSQSIAAIDELKTFGDVAVNCCGLGARELLADSEMIPIRGQVLSVRGNGFSKHITNDNEDPIPYYILPRSQDVILGGSAEVGREDLSPDVTETERILKGFKQLLPQAEVEAILQVKVGLRPGRSAVRLELDHSDEDLIVVHNYGHGGSGVTLSWGCAEEVVALIEGL